MPKSQDNRPAEAFLKLLEDALCDADIFFETVDAPNFTAINKAALIATEEARKEVAEIRATLTEEPEAAQTINEVAQIVGAVPLMTAQASVTKAAVEVKDDCAQGDSLQKGLDVGVTVLKKADKILTDGAIKKLAGDLSEAIPAVGKLIKSSADKVDKVIKDVEELEAKVEYFLHQVTGNPLVKDESKKGGEKIPPVGEDVPEPTLPGSLLFYLADIERKLEYLWKRVNGGSYPRPGDDKLITPLVDDAVNRGEPIGEEIDELCFKVQCLTKLLGRTLYGADWDCDPDVTSPRTPAPPPGELHPVDPQTGLRPADATPPHSIKDELVEIEKCLEEIKECLRFLKEPEIPPEEPPEPPFFVDLKRIFVYEADIFTAASAADAKVVEVRTAAFDLAGWIDLSELGAGDVVTVSLFVILPGGRRTLYRAETYAGAADAGLKSLQDVIGPTIIVGDAVDVEIRQTASTSNFATGLVIPYQFVVESQRLRA